MFREIADTGASLSCVSCPTCSCEIPVQAALRMPRAFSVLCPNCGRRREYQSAELHDAKQNAERIREFSKIQFGRKNVKKIEEEEDIFIQPKTRLNQIVSWLLQ